MTPAHVVAQVLEALVIPVERGFRLLIVYDTGRYDSLVNLRRMALSVEALARKVNVLEGKYDKQFKVVFDAVRRLMASPEHPRRPIGFSADPS